MQDRELRLLLGEAFDEYEAYRRREAAWISAVVHGLVILLLIFLPKWMPTGSVVLPVHEKDNATFLALPREKLKVPAPKTDKLSDQNRIAMTRTPQPNREALRKLIDANRPGPRQPVSPPQQAQPQPQQQVQAKAPAQGGSPAAPQPPQQQQTAKLQAPARPKQNPFTIPSAGASVDQAIQSAAANRGSAGVRFGGDYGSGIRPKIETRGAMDILSDTLGVDFGPYMKKLHWTVEDHWYPLIPDVALPPIMKVGRVIIEFNILKDGRIADLQIVSGSGDTALDNAAKGALTSAVPLPKLPTEFSGEYLRIRAAFYYNPDKHQFE